MSLLSMQEQETNKEKQKQQETEIREEELQKEGILPLLQQRHFMLLQTTSMVPSSETRLINKFVHDVFLMMIDKVFNFFWHINFY